MSALAQHHMSEHQLSGYAFTLIIFGVLIVTGFVMCLGDVRRDRSGLKAVGMLAAVWVALALVPYFKGQLG